MSSRTPTDLVNVDFWADRIAAVIKLAEHHGMTVEITSGELVVRRQVSDAFIAQTEVQWRADTSGERIVAYRSPLPGAWSLYCTRHGYELGDSCLPLTSDDLPDGGVCVRCGVDVLIPQEEHRG